MGERLFFLGIEDVKDSADEKRVAGLLPMIAPFQSAFGIDQNVGDILRVPDFIRALTHFQQGVVAGRPGVGRVEE